MKQYGSKMKGISFCFLACMSLCGCSGIWTRHIVGNYYLTRIDFVEKEQDIAYKLNNECYLGVVEPMVCAIWNNDEYIIAKQCPPASIEKHVRKDINYYIIPLKDKISESPDENVIGPLTLSQFLKEKKDRCLPQNIRFKILE